VLWTDPSGRCPWWLQDACDATGLDPDNVDVGAYIKGSLGVDRDASALETAGAIAWKNSDPVGTYRAIQSTYVFATDSQARYTFYHNLVSPTAWWEGFKRPWQEYGQGLQCHDAYAVGQGTVGIANQLFMWYGLAKGAQAFSDRFGGSRLPKVANPNPPEYDPLARYGSARNTHPAEYEQALRELQEAGVDIDFRPNNMAYSPEKSGPGRMIFDPEGSIGALRHEMQHFRDVSAAGYPGIGPYMAEPQRLAEMERRGYQQEIDYARSIGDKATAQRIYALMMKRIREIAETYGE